MSIFEAFTKPAAIVLAVAAMGSVSTIAQAQQNNRMIVALAPTDVAPSVIEATAAARPASAVRRVASAPRIKRVANAYAFAQKPADDCFWCGRTVFISGLTY